MGHNVMVLVQEGSQQLRHVFLNAAHPASVPSTPLGHSVGQFDGDTLVVETIGLPSGMTLVERLRKVDDGRQLESTVDGSAWLARRRNDAVFVESPCEELADGISTGGSVVPAATSSSAATLEGVWQVQRPVIYLKTGDGQVPPLKTAARTLYKQRVAHYRARDARAREAGPDCRLIGEPRASYEGPPFEIVPGIDTLFIGYSQYRMMRFAYLGVAHAEYASASFGGHWTGRWDGDTLVLDGSGFRADSWLDAAGMPHSDALHLQQRLSLQNGGATLLIQSRFEDPKTFARPWTTRHLYRRLAAAAAISPAQCAHQEAHNG
jgi:hypothetical protein